MVTGLVPQPGVWLLALNIHQTCFEQPGLLEADGVHLSEKAKSTFTHRLAKLENRALNYNCWGGEPQSIPFLSQTASNVLSFKASRHKGFSSMMGIESFYYHLSLFTEALANAPACFLSRSQWNYLLQALLQILTGKQA